MYSGDCQRVVLARSRTASCLCTQNAGVDHAGPAKTTTSTSWPIRSTNVPAKATQICVGLWTNETLANSSQYHSKGRGVYSANQICVSIFAGDWYPVPMKVGNHTIEPVHICLYPMQIGFLTCILTFHPVLSLLETFKEFYIDSTRLYIYT